MKLELTFFIRVKRSHFGFHSSKNHGAAPCEHRGAAPAGCDGARDTFRDAAANGPPRAEKTGKTMKKATRSPFLAPFRADRATAASDIVVRMVVDDLRHLTAAAAHKMSVFA